MLPLFALRLALGLMLALILLSPKEVAQRFYRTQFLVILGFSLIALVFFLRATSGTFIISLSIAVGLSFLGALICSIEGSPGGALVMLLTLIALGLTLWWLPLELRTSKARWSETSLLINDLTSAFFLGVAMTAMLLGHSYLIASSMSIRPLMRLLLALFLAIGLRLIIGGIALHFWTRHHSLFNLRDITVLWLPIRWILGIVIPTVLGWMAWKCGRIRSTQSATGILYIAVVLCFLGELTAQLLLSETGYPL